MFVFLEKGKFRLVRNVVKIEKKDQFEVDRDIVKMEKKDQFEVIRKKIEKSRVEICLDDLY